MFALLNLLFAALALLILDLDVIAVGEPNKSVREREVVMAASQILWHHRRYYNRSSANDLRPD